MVIPTDSRFINNKYHNMAVMILIQLNRTHTGGYNTGGESFK